MLPTVNTYCPYCGEPVQLIVDPSTDEQHYIEDCTVCCRPMEITCRCNGETIEAIEVRRDDD